MIKKKRVMAAKIETTAGTVETLANADAAFIAFDISAQPNIETIPRMANGSMSNNPAERGARQGTISFKVELRGDGAGGVPGWASTLLPACGYVNSGGVFSPSSESPGSNVKTVTIAAYEDGMKKFLRGAVGTFVATFPTGKPIMLEFTFFGVWQTPEDATLLTPTYPTEPPFRFAAATFTIGGSAMGCTETITIDAGNQTLVRPCPTNADGSGLAAGHILDRTPGGTLDPEAVLVATDPVYTKWINGTEQALVIEVADANDTITVDAPKMQYVNVQEGDRSGLQTDTITFQLNKSADAGDDELTLTFAATP